MKRYAISLAILILGVFWIGVGAPVWGGVKLLEESEPAPRTAASPTESPEKDAQVREILSQNDAIKGILAGREQGRDYWTKIDYVYPYAEPKSTGEKPIAMVNMFFDPPVSWAGEVPTKSNPCQGHYQDDWLDPNDPCRNEPPQYGTGHAQFSATQGITAEVDLRRGQVVEVFEVGGSPLEIRDAQRGYATAGSPEKDAQVRGILFGNEAVEQMVAGREEGRDYWVKIGYVYAPREPSSSDEKTLAIADVYFDPPVSWSGLLPTRLDPCQGHYQDGSLDPNDPCRSEPAQFGPAYQQFYGADGITADVDLRSGQVLQVLPVSALPGEIEDAKRSYAP